SRKPAVAQDAGVTRYFDKNVFKTKLETKRSVSFICPGNNHARRVDIANAARLADRAIAPENHERTYGKRQPDRVSAHRGLADRPDCLIKQRHRWPKELLSLWGLPSFC